MPYECQDDEMQVCTLIWLLSTWLMLGPRFRVSASRYSVRSTVRCCINFLERCLSSMFEHLPLSRIVGASFYMSRHLGTFGPSADASLGA